MEKCRSTRKIYGACLTGTCLLAAAAAWGQAPTSENLRVQTYPIRDDYYHLYLVVGAGQNSVLQTGDDGSILVNAGSADQGPRLLDAVDSVTKQPIRYVINTSASADAVGGNAAVAQAGRGIYDTGPTPIELAGRLDRAATILAAAGVSLRMAAPTGQPAPFPSADWPTQTFSGSRYYIDFNHEAVELYHTVAHDESDTIVFFRGANVIAAGNIIDANRFPYIDVKHGGSIQAEIAALNQIINLSDAPTPFMWAPGGTYIVPAYGRLYQQFDVVYYRDMLIEIEGTIQDMINRKMTLQQIEAAHPCLAWEPQYGRDSGPWTTNDFVEAVYRGLAAKKTAHAGGSR